MRSNKITKLLTIDDMRAQARRTLPRMLFDFVDGGAGDEAMPCEIRRRFKPTS